MTISHAQPKACYGARVACTNGAPGFYARIWARFAGVRHACAVVGVLWSLGACSPAVGNGARHPMVSNTAPVGNGVAPLDLAAHVDPFIGTGGHGHTFPGPSTPFGLVQLSPDTDVTEWDWCAGYHYDDASIMGFSHTHLNGAGAGDLGDVLLMPFTGEARYHPGKKGVPGDGFRSAFSHSEERAEPGYYAVTLADHHVVAELTATAHVGVHRYTWREAGPGHVAVDLFHSIHNRKTVESEITLVDDHTVTGFRTVTGWAPLRHVYFAVKFQKPWQRAQIYYDDKQGNVVTGDQARSRRHHMPQGAMTWFDMAKGEVVMVKVGISTTSTEDALASIQRETPGWDFDGVRAANRALWNREFNRLQVTAPPDVKKLFYTSFYRALMAPNDIADAQGRYPGPDNAIHPAAGGHFYSTFSLWDTHRALHPFFTLLMPERVGAMVNSLLDAQDATGVLPLWPLWGVDTNAMIGNPAVPVLVDAVGKHIDGVDPARAYAAIRGTLTRDHYLSPWNLYDRLGYFPADSEPQSVSRTLEASRDDACAARLATALGQTKDAAFFAARAQNYRHLYDADAGFFRGKNADGAWRSPFDPHAVDPTSFTEATAWQYRFSVVQDVPGLVSLMGGPAAFITKLDAVFEDNGTTNGTQLDITGFVGQYAHGNEPSHHMAYLYDYAGAPWKSQAYVARVMQTQYAATPAGLSGNEDGGQMSAWYLCSALGLYPVDPCSGEYALGSPAVDNATLMLDQGRQLTVTVQRGAPADVYIAKVTWNGMALPRPFISHAQLRGGGTLAFTMAAQPTPSAFIPASKLP